MISPAEMNDHLRTLIVAPMTTHNRVAPFRVDVRHAGKGGRILLGQIRAVDRSRLIQRFGAITPECLAETLTTLREVFSD